MDDQLEISPAVPGLSILMPVYDEASTILTSVERALSTPLPTTFELVVVDDGSNDGTAELLARFEQDARVRLIAHTRNRGKGAAVRTGLAAARGDYTAILDADLELDPRDLGPMLATLGDGDGDMTIGARSFNRSTGQSLLFRAGNRGVTFVAGLLFGTRVGDLMTGLKMMRTSYFRSLDLREDGFAIEAEIVAQVLRRGGRIAQVPIAYEPRRAIDGKKLTTLDGLRVTRTLLRCRLGQ